MPGLNVIELAKIERQLANIEQSLQRVEAFFVGVPVDSLRIADLAVDTANIADLSATNAKFASLAITNAKMTSVDAAKFTAGTLSADRIAAGSITAAKLSVSTLSAIAVNVGTITGGSITGNTITGGTVRTASSGARAEMTGSPNALRLFNSSSDVKYQFDPDGLKINDIGTHWYRFSDGTFWGSFFMTTTTQVTLQAGGSVDLDFISGQSGGDLQIVSASNQINIWPGGGGQVYVNGSPKAAIVPTKSGYRALYCLESPEVWFFDFVKDLNNIDDTFLDVTSSEQNVLKTDQGEYLVFRKRKGHEDTRFEQKTLEQFNSNNKFWGNHGFK